MADEHLRVPMQELVFACQTTDVRRFNTALKEAMTALADAPQSCAACDGRGTVEVCDNLDLLRAWRDEPCPACAAAPQPATPGQRMIRAAEEAVAIARGEAEPASVYPAPQPVPVDREALVALIEDALYSYSDDRGWEPTGTAQSIADALLARGLRLPAPETRAWAVVGKDGLIKHVTGNGRNLARQWAGPGDSIERVAFRRVEGGDDAA